MACTVTIELDGPYVGCIKASDPIQLNAALTLGDPTENPMEYTYSWSKVSGSGVGSFETPNVQNPKFKGMEPGVLTIKVVATKEAGPSEPPDTCEAMTDP